MKDKKDETVSWQLRPSKGSGVCPLGSIKPPGFLLRSSVFGDNFQESASC